MVSKNNRTNDNPEELDLGQLLEKRARLDNILKKKFIKQIAVMFTDLKDSTSLAESEGDLAVRLLIKRPVFLRFLDMSSLENLKELIF